MRDFTDDDAEELPPSNANGTRCLSARAEREIWEIHAYARENRNSLDSERHTRMIREAMQRAVNNEIRRLKCAGKL